jgi:hypothetical protein
MEIKTEMFPCLKAGECCFAKKFDYFMISTLVLGILPI